MIIKDSTTGLYYEVQIEDGQLKIVETTETSSTASIVVGTNSWVTLAEAEDYFAGRLGASTFWTSAADKTAALITAYRQLIGCEDFSIETTETAQNVKNAQCEMALFLLQHLSDMDARLGLQAQGVTRADIVGETYKEDARGKIAIPAGVRSLLEEYESVESTSGGLYATDVTRDDDEDV